MREEDGDSKHHSKEGKRGSAREREREKEKLCSIERRERRRGGSERKVVERRKRRGCKEEREVHECLCMRERERGEFMKEKGEWRHVQREKEKVVICNGDLHQWGEFSRTCKNNSLPHAQERREASVEREREREK